LVYKHNQHQVDACEQLAKDMGFKWFRAKVSKRPLIKKLEAPIGWHRPTANQGSINCHAVEEKSSYIDAHGRLHPCCWLGSSQTNFVNDDINSIKLTWKTDTPNPVCKQSCSSNKQKTSFSDQWQREIEFV
jgi:hypothetical protein